MKYLTIVVSLIITGLYISSCAPDRCSGFHCVVQHFEEAGVW